MSYTPGPWEARARALERELRKVVEDHVPTYPGAQCSSPTCRYAGAWSLLNIYDGLGPDPYPEHRADAAAPDLLEAAEALAAMPHVLQVREDGWGLQHPLGCRPGLFECEVNIACTRFERAPAPVGEYAVHLDREGEVFIDGPAPADPADRLRIAIAKARGEA